jgi:hypothetical protein
MALLQRRRPFMISDLMSLLVDEVALFQTSGARDLLPRPGLSWRLFVPLVFCNQCCCGDLRLVDR